MKMIQIQDKQRYTLLLYICAFFAARAEVAGQHPFAVAVYIAAYLVGQSSLILFGVILLGLLSTFSVFSAIRYGVILFLISIVFRLLQGNGGKGREEVSPWIYAGASGLTVMLYSAMYQLLFVDGSKWYISVIEGILAAAFSLMIRQAFLAILDNRNLTEGENMVGSLVLLAVVLDGVPLQFAGYITVLQTVIYYMLLLLPSRYGMAYGIGSGAICGVMLAVRLQKVEWLAVCVILGLVTGLFSEWNKIISILAFLLLATCLGIAYEPQLVEVMSLRGLISASLLYLCTPKWILVGQQEGKRGGRELYIQDVMQKSLKQQVRDYAAVFKRLGTSFSEPVPAYAEGEALFARQLEEVGNSLQEFSDEMSDVLPMETRLQNAVCRRFEQEHVRVKDMVMLKGQHGRKELFVSARTMRGRVMTTKEAAELLSEELNTRYRVSTSSRMIINRDYDVICFEEDTRYRYLMGARRRSRDGEMVSGDNFSQMELMSGQLFMLLADGMGSGVEASEQSEQLVNLLEDMLEAGFKKESAIHMLNELLTVKSQGETFATLDLCMVDLYTGVGEFLKMGASVTLIKRGDWIETIQSTSLPIGIKEHTEIDTIQKKLYHGDMVIMISDGLLDGIGSDNKEEKLKELLLSIKTHNPQELADALIERITELNPQGMRDDATVLVLGVWKKR